ncbi:MAG: hypothetical protein M1819_005518 [Sarea resinae]|nr:MAG: hypothetical protein M1819_005518 [Sarea resinae]
MNVLSLPQLQGAVLATAQTLDALEIDYAIMGGAAVCLLVQDPSRQTEDVDLVIHVDQRTITADRLTQRLLTSHSSLFGSIDQYGHTIPGYKMPLPGGGHRLVQLEIFDLESWPHRPQYNLATASRRTVMVQGHAVKVFSPAWLLREKVLSQYQRPGGLKGRIDIRDIIALERITPPAGQPEVDFGNDHTLATALVELLRKRPDLRERLKRKIKCAAVFGD